MPISAKTLFALLVTKTFLFTGIGTLHDPMEEPVPYIFAAVFALAVASLKTRRAWWFVLLVEVLTLAGCLASIKHQMSQGSSGQQLMMIVAAFAIVAVVGIALVLSRSVRGWYKSRKNDSTQSPLSSSA